MECSPALIRIVIIIAGLVLAIVGMLGYTGLIGWAVPRSVMFVGWGLIIAGIVSGYIWSDYGEPETGEDGTEEE
ncbi:MAG: hypothetical protein II848_02530 [Candidatus Methanomethylophilus sp.]|nr:hypothetical protein [Methanomethylophilus sp.]